MAKINSEKKDTISKNNEKISLYAGLLIGLSGGIIGNFLVGSYYKLLVDPDPNFLFATFIVAVIAISLIIYQVFREMDKLNDINKILLKL